MAFENLIGNETVKKLLSNTVEQDKITHSYLFLGPSGIGKTLFAKEFAKMILGSSEENQPDLIFMEPEDGTIKIEKIRQMQEKLLEKPIISSKKVYIIKDADMMTKEAGNCLLKTLEEPPKFITIILVASNESLLLNTIRSRCMKILFHKIEQEPLKKYLEGHHIVEELTLERLKSFDGSIEKALRIEEKKEVYDEIQKIFGNVEQYRLLDVKDKLEALYKNRDIIYDLLDYINLIFIQKATTNTNYITYIETIEEVKKNLKSNSNYDMCIDKILYKIWEE